MNINSNDVRERLIAEVKKIDGYAQVKRDFDRFFSEDPITTLLSGAEDVMEEWYVHEECLKLLHAIEYWSIPEVENFLFNTHHRSQDEVLRGVLWRQEPHQSSPMDGLRKGAYASAICRILRLIPVLLKIINDYQESQAVYALAQEEMYEHP